MQLLYVVIGINMQLLNAVIGYSMQLRMQSFDAVCGYWLYDGYWLKKMSFGNGTTIGPK